MKKNLFLFPSCVGSILYKDIVLLLKNFLNNRGFKTFIIKKPFCCGQVFYNTGNLKETHKILFQICKHFKNKEILILSGSCLEFLVKNIPKILGKDLNFKIKEITEFFIEEKLVDFVPEYHKSCHFKTLKGEKLDFFSCCGFGGVFSSLYPQISDRIFKIKFKETKKVLSCEPGCSLFILSKGLKTEHPLESIIKKIEK
ncbi:MAG: (Fe-S)-binding protein [Candidatus Hydrothermales bacterium]